MDLDQQTYGLIRDTASDVKHIREILENSQRDIADHEARIRILEDEQRTAAGMYRGAAKVAGIVALIISIVVAGLPVLISLWGGC
jgi:hypothetical protein